MGNITAITDILDPAKTKTFAYDLVYQLTQATGPWGSILYSYDPVGNRITETAGAAVTNYTYSANRLMTATGGKTFSFSYDNNGNAVTEDQRQYVYNQNQRLIKALDNATVLGQYVYDGKGQTAKKTVNGQTTLYHYDLEGHLIAESTASGAITATYVYVQGQPIAKIDGNALYFYHNDHLGTPMMVTDQNKNIVWQGEHLPFGEPQSITGTITNKLRFPGQYYDAETGLHYNYFRDYMPEMGRYIEKDPIGLKGGPNLYAYAENNPLNRIDPLGLTVYPCMNWFKQKDGIWPHAYVCVNNNCAGLYPEKSCKDGGMINSDVFKAGNCEEVKRSCPFLSLK